MADLRVADQRSSLCDQGAVLLEQRIADELRMPRERTDRDRVAVLADVAQVVQTADVDEQGRARETQPHRGDQRVPAGEELRILVTAEQFDRLLDRARPRILERGGDHAPALAAACTALTMLW
jgi:hypothetical protein